MIKWKDSAGTPSDRSWVDMKFVKEMESLEMIISCGIYVSESPECITIALAKSNQNGEDMFSNVLSIYKKQIVKVRRFTPDHEEYSDFKAKEEGVSDVSMTPGEVAEKAHKQFGAYQAMINRELNILFNGLVKQVVEKTEGTYIYGDVQ